MSRAISRLVLVGFRSYRSARIAPAPGPIILHGRNGVGKTNLIEAVSLLSPGRGLRRAAPADLAGRSGAAGAWRISAEIVAGESIHEIDTRALAGASRQVGIDAKAVPQHALGRIGRILWLVPAMDRLWIEGAEGRRRFLDRVTLSFEPGHARAAQTYDRAMRERNRLLREGSGDARWYAALEARMAEAGAVLIANRRAALARLAQVARETRTGFPVPDLSLRQPSDSPVPAIGEETDAIRAALARSRPADLRAGRSLVGPHRVDLEAVYSGAPAARCSTGEQKALLISIVLANARALAAQTGAPPILLLDEVAAHLDEARRIDLFDELCRLGVQAWMTGTEPGLFAALVGRAQFLEVVADGDGSQIRPG